jgi:hypothetical protein
MNSAGLIASVAVLLALQFTAFGWRITRELQMEDAKRRTWFPLPDYLNVASMLVALFRCVIHATPQSMSVKAEVSRPEH